MPEARLRSLKIVRVFRSTTIPDRLYAEFEEESFVHFIYSFVRFLSPAIHLHLYVPHSFLQRYLAIKNIEYPIRKGPGNYKTMIKFGFDDFILSKKVPTEAQWTNVPLCPDSLPPVDLTPLPQHSDSPPIGRSRLLKRKERSPLEPSRDVRRKSLRSSSPEQNTPDPVTTQEEQNINTPDETQKGSQSNPQETPPRKDPAVSLAKDIGSFQPSAVVSPSTAANKNFTFGTNQSNIPKMKSLLN